MKIGRNDPCPCGSGKKYKMCCIQKENLHHRIGLTVPDKPSKKQQLHETALSIRIASIKELIEGFGIKHFTPEYTTFALNLCDKVSVTSGLNIHRGKKTIWAAAIVYVIARLNFLFDMEGEIVLTPALICSYFDTVKSTTSSKASKILNACEFSYGAKGFCRKEIVDAFTFYETSDGFILPKSIVDKIESEEEEKEIPENPALRIIEYRRRQEKIVAQANTKSKERLAASKTKKFKPEDDKQMKLFDD